MGNKAQPAAMPIQAIKNQIRELDQLLANIRQQVQDAQAKGPAFQEALVDRQEKAAAKLTAQRKKIASAKAHCKKRKREIDEWKLWYAGIEQADKSAELAQLNLEIEWRAADIAAKEFEISSLYTELLIVEGEDEQLTLQLEALNTLTATDPVDADPRIQHILQEKEKLNQQLF